VGVRQYDGHVYTYWDANAVDRSILDNEHAPVCNIARWITLRSSRVTRLTCALYLVLSERIRPRMSVPGCSSVKLKTPQGFLPTRWTDRTWFSQCRGSLVVHIAQRSPKRATVREQQLLRTVAEEWLHTARRMSADAAGISDPIARDAPAQSEGRFFDHVPAKGRYPLFTRRSPQLYSM